MSKPWEQEWKRNGIGHIEATDAIQVEVKTAFWRVPEGEAEAFRQVEETQQFVLAAPDMARALMAIRSRVAEAGDALPRPRNADEMAALEESYVTIPTEMLRAAFAALRKAGAL